MLRLTLAQINPTIGDIEGNVALMRETARAAYQQGARLVIFPELSLTAYYPGDLLEDAAFMRRVADGLQALLAATREFPGLHWVIGAPTRNDGVGKHFHNSLLVLKDGEVLLTYHKQLLPTYNVFDERRHFEPGPDVARVLEIEGVRCGFMICEDGWNDDGQDYAVNPFVRLEDAAPDLVVSINASPSNLGKRAARHEIFARASARHRFPIVYVNQVAGPAQLVYDGASFIVDPVRGLVCEARQLETDAVTVQLGADGAFSDAAGHELAARHDADLDAPEFYRRQIVLGLRDYARRCGFRSV